MPRLLTATTAAHLTFIAPLLLGAGCITWSTEPQCDECDDDDDACKMKACVGTDTSDTDAPTTSATTSSSSSGTSSGTTTDPTTEPTTTDPTSDTTTNATTTTTGPEPFCGDGVVDAGEECDDGEAMNDNTAACKADCTDNVCGDEHVLAGVEECDDGAANNIDTAACKSDCTAQTCGDGHIGPGENCDDNNAEAGDGCSATCQRETLIAFVTSTTYTGNLAPPIPGKTGLDLADAHCQARADSAGLPGSYRAWLSTAANGPAGRFALNPFPGQFKLTTGAVIAESWADLTDGSLLVALDRDESGKQVPISLVWSNTQSNGNPVGTDHCTNWSSGSSSPKGRVGATEFANGSWTNIDISSCASPARLYCFQVTP